MKPKIFLSHTKKDKDFIYKLANDLRNVQIDVWVDEWEIPLGESIRRKIFEEGIPFCDLFFVYITNNSIDSYWVQKELDSAIIIESERKNSFLALFVENNELRDKLSPDLKSIIIPEFNNNDYLIPFAKLISKAWQVFSKKNEKIINEKNRIKLLETENEKLKLTAEITRLNTIGQSDFESTIIKLKDTKVFINEKDISLAEIFNSLKFEIATGATERRIENILNKIYNKDNNIDADILTFINGFFYY